MILPETKYICEPVSEISFLGGAKATFKFCDTFLLFELHSDLFWIIVETVLTHDGLKLTDGVLCNEEDLMRLLLVCKLPNLWIMDKIAKFLSHEQIARLYYTRGCQIKL